MYSGFIVMKIVPGLHVSPRVLNSAIYSCLHLNTVFLVFYNLLGYLYLHFYPLFLSCLLIRES